MTDNEIIKAFKLCKDGSFEKCNECPIRVPGKDDIFTCLHKKQELTFDLITRQKAEIKKLKRENEILSIDADTAFQDGLNEAQDLYAEQVRQEVKSEAIKEFAERLKEKMRLEDDCEYDCGQCCYECKEYVPIIDNLVKEMTEVQR